MNKISMKSVPKHKMVLSIFIEVALHKWKQYVLKMIVYVETKCIKVALYYFKLFFKDKLYT